VKENRKRTKDIPLFLMASFSFSGFDRNFAVGRKRDLEILKAINIRDIF
jgi:hypothetical protein